jgi:hypothetical protein
MARSRYPRDEFDNLAPVDRRGAHRVAPAKLGGVTATVFVVVLAIVAILLGVAVFNIIRSGQAGPDNPVVAGQDGGGATTKAPTPTASATESESADIDRSLKVSVLNSTSKTGLASTVAKQLGAADWSNVTAGSIKSPLTTTTVFYSTDDLKATAQAIADDLGTEAIKKSTDYTAKLTVLVASDFKPES